jgi:diketogulonate reductase-like aldo/keto reductase
VSNFGIDELAELLAMARIKPALVQRNSDPLSADAEVQAFCRMSGILYQVIDVKCPSPVAGHCYQPRQ